MDLPRLAPDAPDRAVPVPGSKSVTNRALLLAAMAPGVSTLRGGLDADDTRVLREALRACGIPVERTAGRDVVRGGAPPAPAHPLWLGASGTSLRFLLPWLATRATGPVHLRGTPRLFARPLGPLVDALSGLGATWTALGPAEAELRPAPPRDRLDVSVDASLSSQFVTGLALASAALPEGGRIAFGAAASPSYLELTRAWLARFGCGVHEHPGAWEIPGGALRPADLTLPADWSAAAAFLAAGTLVPGGVEVEGLDPDDPQGDRALLDVLAAAGARVTWPAPGRVRVRGPLLRGLHAELSACPDLGPVLAALAALAPGPSVLSGLHTLRHKESDRLDAAAALVAWLGGAASIEGDTLRVSPGPPPPLDRPPWDPRDDHRLAFAAALGGLVRGGAITVPECVAKTFPTFWEEWSARFSPRTPRR